jgi:hypothetical protein
LRINLAQGGYSGAPSRGKYGRNLNLDRFR